MEGGVDNCLVIIHSSLLPVFPLSAGEFLFPVKEGSSSVLWPSAGETLSWAGVSAVSTFCPWKAEFAGHLSKKPKEEKRDPAPFQVNIMRQVAVKEKGRWQRKFCFSVERAQPGVACTSLLCREPTVWPRQVLNPLSPGHVTCKISVFTSASQVLCGNWMMGCV